MKKRILSLLLVICVIISLTGFTFSKAKKDETYTINISIPVLGSAPPDMQKVFDKANEIILKKINAKLVVKPVSIFNLANIYALSASSGEKSDLIVMVPGASYLPIFSGNKMLMPLDDLIAKYGTDLKKGLGDLIKVGQYDGKQFAIPMKEISNNANGVLMVDSIVKKYHINLASVKTYNDLDPIFAKIHAGEPNMQMFFPSGTGMYLCNFDNLGNSLGVLTNSGVDNTKVVNEYETKEWIAMVKKMREWYLKGYISKDYATTQDSPDSLIHSNKLFMEPSPVNFDKPGLGDPLPINYIKLFDPVKITSNFQMFMWGVPSSCKNPEKSIQFLNLLYQDSSLATLLKYGIEGVQYTKTYTGTMVPSKGFNDYNYFWGIYGDPNKYPISDTVIKKGTAGGSILKYYKLKNDWTKTVKTSKAFGFTFNQDKVKTEISACTAVTDQYLKLLESGSVDPDKEIKNFNDKLYASGLQKIMDEKQRQLNAWLKLQK